MKRTVDFSEANNGLWAYVEVKEAELATVTSDIEAIDADVQALEAKIKDLQGQIEAKNGKITSLIIRRRNLEYGIAVPRDYKAKLVRFIGQLREGRAGDWDFDLIVGYLFDPNDKCILNYNDREADLSLPQKREIISGVLAETGLTHEEALTLVKRQREVSQADATRMKARGM